MFLSALLLVTAGAFAQEPAASSSLHLPLEDVAPVVTEAPPARSYSGLFDMELRSDEDLRDRPTNRSRQDLYDLSLGGSYTFDRHISATVELSMEQIHEQSTFFAKQAVVDWTPVGDYGRLRLGEMFLPVGLINEQDNLFSSNPPFMQKLFADSKGIDLGAKIDIYPLANSWAYLEGGVFAGRFVREADSREQAPAVAPRVFSLKSHSEFHDAFVSYFEHHLSFFDPIHAWGAGFEVRSPEFHRFRASLLSEYWRIEQQQTLGPNEWDHALLIYATLKWWRLMVGYRWSENHASAESTQAVDILPLEISKLGFFEVELAKPLSVRAERVLETADRTFRDEWVVRALVHYSL